MAIKTVYQHFRPEEYAFIEKIEDLADRVDATYSFTLTSFLNPREVTIAKSVLSHRKMMHYVSSDYYPMEYARVIIAPDYYVLDISDFELALVEISYQSKFNRLTHAQIMGTLLNRLGIKRQVIGDILTNNGVAQLIIDRGMVTYLLDTVSKIGKAGVSLKEVAFDHLILQEQTSKQQQVMVSSLRLDKLIAVVLGLSRQKAVNLITADKVKVNYQLMPRVAETLRVGDLVSVRGFGRFTLVSEDGLTKTGKHKLTIANMIHR